MLPSGLVYSKAFVEYLRNRREVVELLRAVPPDSDQLRLRRFSELANALYRGSVVLMSSHLERYIESLIVEAIDAINSVSPRIDVVPERLRLIQIEQPLRMVYETKEIAKKTVALKTFVVDYSWFWNESQICNKLSSDPLIRSFDNPLPGKIRSLFENFGISDVVGRALALDNSRDRRRIEARVKEMIEKRNAIAHTGMTTDLTRSDVTDYLRCTRKLVRCIDVVVAQEVQNITVDWPWNIMPSLGIV